jgi:hypothetical protein
MSRLAAARAAYLDITGYSIAAGQYVPASKKPDIFKRAIGQIRLFQRCCVTAVECRVSIAKALLQSLPRLFDQNLFSARKIGNVHERYVDDLKPLEKEERNGKAQRISEVFGHFYPFSGTDRFSLVANFNIIVLRSQQIRL